MSLQIERVNQKTIPNDCYKNMLSKVNAIPQKMVDALFIEYIHTRNFRVSRDALQLARDRAFGYLDCLRDLALIRSAEWQQLTFYLDDLADRLWECLDDLYDLPEDRIYALYQSFTNAVAIPYVWPCPRSRPIR